MNDRQRFLAALGFHRSDRIPNYELGLQAETAQRWQGEGMPRNVLWNTWLEGEPFFGIERRGLAHLAMGMLPADETARDSPVTDRASFRGLTWRYDPASPTRYPLWWDTLVQGWKRRDYPLCLFGNVGLYSQLRSWCGTEGLSRLFSDDPALVEEMVEFAVELILRVTERARKEARFDYASFHEDLADEDGPLLSADLFRRFLFGGYRRTIGELRKSGIGHVWLESRGDPRPLVPLMVEAGVSCLWPLDVSAGIDPAALRQQYGRNLGLVGGIDTRELARSREHIERELVRRIPPLLDRGGCIPHLDRPVPPGVSYDNFRYYLDLKTKLLGY